MLNLGQAPSRRQLFEKLKPLVIPNCPFVNLPEKHRSRWGEGVTADEMKKCVWVKPKLLAQIEFLEWTEAEMENNSAPTMVACLDPSRL